MGNAPVVAALIPMPRLDINSKDWTDKTALHRAVEKNNRPLA